MYIVIILLKRLLIMNTNQLPKPTLLSDYPALKETVSNESFIFAQRKLDGWRCIIDTQTGVLYSRSGKIINLPHITSQVTTAFKNVKTRYVDGELYCHGFNLHKIQSMIKLKDNRIEFHCFDSISDDHFYKRSIYLHKAFKETENIKIVKTEFVNTKDIQKTFEKYISEKYEGLIIRIDGFPYIQGRSESVIRMKPKY